MSTQNAHRRLRLYLLGVFILLAGLGAAAFVFFSADDEAADDAAGGGVYVISPRDSKRYRHDVELLGGKAAVLADDFNRWFAGLWQGRRLAWTLAVLAIGGALACFWLADHPAPGQSDDEEG